ncbi:ATP-binding protein [Streptomyces sp. NPDC046805]|uniref:ATP-binding protein n=1 Tax=Streptomyces sp. NPDC046805 TaxID=3155134 RepID=UPI0033F874A5
MTDSTDGYAPHPYIGGHSNALRALAAWRTARPGAPRVVALTGNSGSGRSRLLTGFLMLCDPDSRNRLDLDQLDPSCVPPELPAPAAANARGLTAQQFLWALADHYELPATRTEDIYAELAATGEPVSLVVLDVDQAGPVRHTDEPSVLVRHVLKPLAALDSVRLVAELPRHLVTELAEGLPAGALQIIDLDEPQWTDPEGLVRHAEAALSPSFAGTDVPFTVDPQARHALSTAIGHRAGTSPLVVQLAVQSILAAPEDFDPTDEGQLPTSVGEALDLHAERLGADPQTLRLMLAPLALCEADGLPVHLWARLASAAAGQDMSQAIAGGMSLVGPFVQPVEQKADGDDHESGGHTLLRLLHPAVGDEIRAGLPDVRAAQTRISMALLEAVPEQDWNKADPYVRDHIAGHTLAAGLLPQLLTDPMLFVHADPVPLRAAVEAVPVEELGAPARTYLRAAPLLTRNEVSAPWRAALLETAFVEDGLPEYADALHRLGFELPWQTLWSLPVAGISEVTVGSLRDAEGPATRVAVLVVPPGTPGAQSIGEGDESTSAVLVHGLVPPDGPGDADPVDTNPVGPALRDVDLEQILRPAEEERAVSPLGLSRGADYLRVWDRESGEVVAALISDAPFTSADLSPDGILVVATERGAKALRILPNASAPAS